MNTKHSAGSSDGSSENSRYMYLSVSPSQKLYILSMRLIAESGACVTLSTLA